MLQLYVIQYSHFQVLYLNFSSLSLSLHFFDRQNYNAQHALTFLVFLFGIQNLLTDRCNLHTEVSVS